MEKNQITHPAIARFAAWTLYNEPGFKRDIQRREKNIDRFGKSALCEQCAGTGNAFLFIYESCKACDGTGVERAETFAKKEILHFDCFWSDSAFAI